MLIRNDPQIYNLILREHKRQQSVLNMIPSENFVSTAVLEATGSILTNKYSEGYPAKRYYQGNEHIDDIEILAIERAKKIFGAEHVNVQPLSGSPANQAVLHALLKPGDKIMGLRLDMGGHLTHGHSVNFSARYYTSVPYTVDKKTELLDMAAIRQLALQEKPKMIIAGATAYPRTIDFKAFYDIAQDVGAYFLADISHIAGLVAGGVHPSPFPHADVVMTTTHKTLSGPRSAIIMCKKEDRLVQVEGLSAQEQRQEKDLAGKIDRAVFPGLQGGPHNHVTAAKAVAFQEALQPEFAVYAQQVVKNARALAASLMDNGLKLVTNGTDTHLILIDLLPFGIGLGKKGAVALENAGICTNCNTVPYDPSTPFKPSGIRLGTPSLTTQGMKEKEMKPIGEWIATVLKDLDNTSLQATIKQKVKELCRLFPIYPNLI